MRVYGIILLFWAFCLVSTTSSALSDEAKAAIEKIKMRANQATAELDETIKSTATIGVVEPSPKVRRGMTKSDAIKILGKPDYDTGHYIKYGLFSKVFINNDLVVDWFGFPENSANNFDGRGSEADSIKVGGSKDSVLRAMGKPLRVSKDGKNDILAYHQATFYFKQDKIQKWIGFVDDDPRFDRASNDLMVATKERRSSANTKTSKSSYSTSTRPKLSNGNYTTYTGRRGGVYHYSASGKKVYHSRKRR